MIQENVQEEPLCCEAGGEMERMIENAIYTRVTLYTAGQLAHSPAT